MAFSDTPAELTGAAILLSFTLGDGGGGGSEVFVGASSSEDPLFLKLCGTVRCGTSEGRVITDGSGGNGDGGDQRDGEFPVLWCTKGLEGNPDPDEFWVVGPKADFLHKQFVSTSIKC